MRANMEPSASANATANTYWCVIEVFKDKALLEAVRKEVQASMLERNGDVHFDVNLLIQQPLLQAIFAESLRLRCHNMFIRKTTETIDIGDWAVPGDHFVIAWSTPSEQHPPLAPMITPILSQLCRSYEFEGVVRCK